MCIKDNKGVTTTTIIITLMVMLIILQITTKASVRNKRAWVELAKTSEEQINSSENERVITAVSEAIARSRGLLEKELFDNAMNNKFGNEWKYSMEADQNEKYFLIEIKESGNLYKILKDGTVKEATSEDIEINNLNLIDKTTPILISDYTQIEVGDKIKYDSTGEKSLEEVENWEDWIVFSISEDEKNIEIISCNTMFDENGNGLTIGPSGKNVQNLTINIDVDEDIADEEDRAIFSYNNAIESINQFCKDIIKSKNYDDVYSIGLKEEVSEYYEEGDLNDWFKGDISEIRKGDSFSDDQIYNVSNTENKKPYFVASKKIKYDILSDTYKFYIYTINKQGNVEAKPILTLNSEGVVQGYDEIYGVRPIIKNPQRIYKMSE